MALYWHPHGPPLRTMCHPLVMDSTFLCCLNKQYALGLLLIPSKCARTVLGESLCSGQR